MNIRDTSSSLHKSVQHKKSEHDSASISIGFILCQDFIFNYFSGFVDVLNQLKAQYCDADLKNFNWSVIGEPKQAIRSFCQIDILPRHDFSHPQQYDYIVIIGGSTSASKIVDQATKDFITKAHEHKVPLVAIASGRHVLASQNLLDGRKCAVDALCELQFRAIYPEIETVSYQPFVVDNQLITCPGAGNVMKLASTLLSQYLGEHFMQEPFEEDDISQGQYRSIPINTIENANIKQAIQYMENNLSVPMPIKTLADQLGTTTTELDSIFTTNIGMTPSSVWRKLRLDKAYWLLTHTQRKITDIALECGYYDSAHFNKAFKSSFLETPKVVRRERYLSNSAGLKTSQKTPLEKPRQVPLMAF